MRVSFSSSGKSGGYGFFSQANFDGEEQTTSVEKWKMIVADDEEVLHKLTMMIFEDYKFRNRELEIIATSSGAETIEVLKRNPDTAVLLLDVVMETENAGLDVVKYARNVLKNDMVRIILRTGQPGQAPESEVVNNYDINDYKEKSDLSALKLLSSVTTALRSYADLQKIQNLSFSNERLEEEVARRTRELKIVNSKLLQARDDLEQKVVERTRELLDAKNVAERANAAKSVFLSRMSHELRTPLNAVLGFSELLLLDDVERLSADQVGYLKEIKDAGHHLLNLVEDILGFARVESGTYQLNISDVDIHYVLSSCMSTMLPMASANEIDLAVDITSTEGQIVVADEMRLRQILLNLVSNAIKFNRKGGRVLVRGAVTDHKRFRVSVIDDGPGIAKINQQKVFEPFERLDADKDCIEGTGIGLSICRQFTELMNGTIGLESELGKGAEFWVELPLG